MQIQDVIILLILVVLIVLAGYFSWKHRNNCCGNCAACSKDRQCVREKKRKKS